MPSDITGTTGITAATNTSGATGPVALTEAHRRLDELDRAVAATRQALALLRACLPSPCPNAERPGPIEVSDTPYDPAMWWDAEDEGIGGHRR